MPEGVVEEKYCRLPGYSQKKYEGDNFSVDARVNWSQW